jgi:quinohemoprotein ethanol dehydrogenase
MHLAGRRGGDELYAASIVAIHASDGTLAWYYQTTPGDRWDFDSTEKFVLADLELGGKRRAVLMQAPKNGYYYVLDRATGELISAKPFAFVSWARGLDPKTGRPLLDASADYDHGPALVFPSEAGAHTWQPMAFDPTRGVTFLPVIEAGSIILETSDRRAGLVEGQFTTPALPPELYDPKGYALALRPTAATRAARARPQDQSRLARIPARLELPSIGCCGTRRLRRALTAACSRPRAASSSKGDANGYFNAYSADTGKKLASIALGSSMMAAPVTYAVNGTQYVAIVAGYGGGGVIIGSPLDPESAAYKYGNEGRIIALKLGGAAPPLPPLRTDVPMPELPARPADARQIAAGEVLYNRYCSRCHVMGRGNLPDLRRITPVTHTLFDSIVLGGACSVKGMGRFDDVLSAADAHAIHAWLIDRAWALKAELASAPH